MVQEAENLRNEIIFKAGRIGERMGLNKSMGQLYAALYFEQKAIPLDQLAKLCRMSKGNASINIRRLERWGAVKKVWGDQNRKDYYEANRDIVGFVINHGMRLFSEILEKGDEMLVESKERFDYLKSSGLDKDQKETLASYSKSLEELERTAKKMKGLSGKVKLLEKFIR